MFFAPSAFNRLLIQWNGLDAAGFAAWEFLPGMRFGERAAWWRGGEDRSSAHEGLDIRCYRTTDGRRLSLGAGARVPAIYAGKVVALVADFLGTSLFIAHECRDGSGRQLHTIFGHLVPHPGLAPGCPVAAEDELGSIADTSGRKLAPAPHLHLTLALINREAGPERLDWDTLQQGARAVLLDPMIIMK